jgi:hypothetical protein
MSHSIDIGPALDAIERHEARFLAWGILDRALSRHEIEELLTAEGADDPRPLFEELRRRQLIFGVPRSAPPLYRTRMAEGVRLFATLRQQFENRPWGNAPRLVADFRFLVRPRRFPARRHELDAVLARLGGTALAPKARTALDALLRSETTGTARRLSTFQVEASAEILRGLASEYDQACIVTAGTGSGKTLAFYLPTLLHLVSSPNRGRGTNALAVYPRNELLKDQLLATIREIRRMRAVDPTLPVVRVGAYFGLTPPRGGARPMEEYLGWRKVGSDYVCPFLVCPGNPPGGECGGRLLWRDSDRSADINRLVCSSCGSEVGPDELALTRNAMQDRPPDILFTTTEMLNRSLSDGWSCHVFGIGPRAGVRPRIVLLDEAHTYSGPSGAQAAYVLRRWRHLAGGPVMWVGLSATLRDAEQFFAKLSGVSADFVREVTPLSDDLEQRGHEYQLLLRGDPASQTALLSTSIQSLMLLLRLLDPLGEEPSLGTFGHKVFAFCDNLDLTNRLFRQLLDAEGRTPVGKPDPVRRGSLALLRSKDFHPAGSSVANWDERDRDGQYWWMIDDLRTSAVPPVIGRTSSQDAGVATDAETVIATASLEVGYDDPSVGAVLQHKAPRDLAQFMQRRGRAGRSQSMRPWTVVVLSDYGRDRLAYQSYERLFDPALPPKSLPLGNRSVQRMQATFAVIDWIATELRRQGGYRDTVRAYLSEPQAGERRSRQLLAASLLREVLDDGPRRRELTTHLQRSLRLSSDEIDVLLWEGPRSVLLEAIPTAVRRIESDWHVVADGEAVPGGDRSRRDHPLPEFLPANLFSDLALPEIRIAPPEGYDKAADAEEAVFLVLNELAPGNVTLRYAVWKTKGLWIDPGEDGRLDITESLVKDVDVVTQLELPDGRSVEVLRPFTVYPQVPARDVQSTSKGRLNWDTRVTPIHGALEADVPESGAWSTVIERVDFFLQAGRGGVHLLRYALGGTAEVGRDRRDRSRVTYDFVRGDEPVAVGVELDLDSLRVRVTPPADLEAFHLGSDERRLRQLRRDFLLWHAEEQLGELDGLNPFLASWLAELLISATASTLVESAKTSPAAWTADEWQDRMLGAFDAAFGGLQSPSSSRTEDEPPLRDAVAFAVERADVRTRLAGLWNAMSIGPDESWYAWLRQRFVVTAAAAVHSAVQVLLPDFDAESDLTVDLVDEGAHVDMWISDVAVGGGGLVESLYAAYTEDPRRFWHLALAALESQDLEQASDVLSRVVEALTESELAQKAAAYRTATNSDQALSAWRELLASLALRGLPPSHALTVALSTRVLRPGSSVASDRAIQVAVRNWDDLERRLGVALDHRSACALLASRGEVLEALRRAVIGTGRQLDEGWAFSVLLNVLWSRPEGLRGNGLRPPMPFVDRPPASERTLVLDALAGDTTVVNLSDDEWRTAVDAALRSRGRCVIQSPIGSETALHDALIDLMVRPAEVGSLFLHPRVVGLSRTVDALRAILDLVEAPQ